MKVLICGDRHWTDRTKIVSWIAKLKDQGFDTVIEGEARGADTMAREEALNAHIKVIAVPADWKIYGRSAGPIRNKEMLCHYPDLVVAFHSDIEHSKGTKNMIEQAKKAEIEVILVE